MECSTPLQLNDRITEKGQWRLIGRRHGRLLSNGMRVEVPPQIKFPTKGVSASNSTSATLPHVQPDQELEEMKGFMELGFQFSEDELSPRVLTVLPGLKRFGCQHQNTVPTEAIELPSPNVTSAELTKEHLRLWARSVASMVKC